MSNNRDLLVAGLGNPGSEYAQTRHNAGVLALESFADQLERSSRSGSLGWKEKFAGRYAIIQDHDALKDSEIDRLILLKPDTYMNESGRAVAAACTFFKIPPTNICILHDELDLPLGRLQFKRGGGHGGHNGVRSVSQSLGKSDFLRLRIGIGRPNLPGNADNRGDLVHSWVLGRFSKTEASQFDTVTPRVCDALETLMRDGFEKAQTQANTR